MKSCEVSFPKWKGDKEVRLNDYLTLKLKKRRTNIYVKGNKFSHCMYLLIKIPNDEIPKYDDINSIDEAVETLNRSLEYPKSSEYKLPPKTEFMGHCSNLQAWAENNYDTRILHSNIAFPLLKALADAGAPEAKMRLREEIVLRANAGYKPVIEYLAREGFFYYLETEDFEHINNQLAATTIAKKGYWKILDYVSDESSIKGYFMYSYVVCCILRGNSQVEELDLNGHVLKNLPEKIGKLTGLKRLNLRNSRLKKLPESMGKLRNLQELGLWGNNISEIKGLEELKELRLLYLERNNISEIKGLENLIKLGNLDLGSNNISEIKGLEGLTKLQMLRLGHNHISEIKGLENLVNLQILDLSRNNIREIKGLEKLTKLEKLYLNDNNIREIKGLENLVNLEILELSRNNISEIKGLEKLTNLTYLFLNNNKLSYWRRRKLKPKPLEWRKCKIYA